MLWQVMGNHGRAQDRRINSKTRASLAEKLRAYTLAARVPVTCRVLSETRLRSEPWHGEADRRHIPPKHSKTGRHELCCLQLCCMPRETSTSKKSHATNGVLTTPPSSSTRGGRKFRPRRGSRRRSEGLRRWESRARLLVEKEKTARTRRKWTW